MKRNIIVPLLVVLMLTGCSGGNTEVTTNQSNPDMVTDTTVKAEPKAEEQNVEDEQSNSDTEYHLGDTWTVDGQWSLTVNSITETDFRNEYSDTNPNHVYMIDYSYENLGYVDSNGIMDGLFLELSSGQIVDSDGLMGAEYPGDIANYPQEVPVKAKCNAQSCIGVDGDGPITIYFSQYDGNSNEQKATFILEP